jgi:hypothetical protein
MKRRTISNVAASVHARLLNLARAEGRPFSELLQYYAMERFLYRLSCSAPGDRFVLKGALMLQIWGDLMNRSTRDIDLLGRVAPLADMIEMVRACVAFECENDGLCFDIDSVSGTKIRLAADYDGVRVRCAAYLGNARVVLQIDIGFGDVITPRALHIEYPTLLGFTAARLLGYPPETCIAEKFQALVALDMANTRLKDFLDIWTLSQGLHFNGAVLAEAVTATFQRRRTPLPTAIPIALTAAFHSHPEKQAQWQAYLRKGRVRGQVPALHNVAYQMGTFLMPVVEAVNARAPFDQLWPPGGPWAAGAVSVCRSTPPEPEG